MKFQGEQLDNWVFYLDRLDDTTLAVVCCGYIETSTALDSKMIAFSQSTQLLGRPSQAKNDAKVFHQIKLQDIENNEWMPRS